MSSGQFLDLAGTVGRTCPDCGVMITVVRPPRPLSGATTAKERKHLGAELKRQVLWDILCPSCLEWWNGAIQRCEEGLTRKRAAP
jgi:predicted RNA-binding Zn-ribbon protein involved in translation (DUF1610 family)